MIVSDLDINFFPLHCAQLVQAFILLLSIMPHLMNSSTEAATSTTQLYQRNTVWFRNRQRDPYNTIERPEINPHIYGNLIYGKSGISIPLQKIFFKWTFSKTNSPLQVNKIISQHTWQLQIDWTFKWNYKGNLGE